MKSLSRPPQSYHSRCRQCAGSARSLVFVRSQAGGSDNGEPAATSTNNAPSSSKTNIDKIKLPKTGYFTIADPNQEVYSKLGEKFDPTKKGGRYKSEFIWNTNWQEALKIEEDLERQQREAKERQKQGPPPSTTTSGTVSFTRLADLNDMSVDLSAQLMRKSDDASTSTPAPPKQPAPRKAPAPSVPLVSRNDAKRLERVSRITNQMQLTVNSTKAEDEEEQAKRIEEERIKYERMKQDFLIWTLGFTALGTATTYASYGTDASVSYSVGAIGGLVYLRLLGRTVDSVGSQSLEGATGSAAGQPRLLIPVILALVYNRWNQLYADQAGISLMLLPMLVGFFTYKMAVIAREGKELLAELSRPSGSSQ